MRKWIVAGAILVSMIGVAVLLLLNLNSLIARNKSYLLAQAEQALGRKISVGEVEATLFTGLGLKLTDFAMTDDPTYSSEDFVRAKDLQVNVKFWPLLRRELQVKRVILHAPMIRIVRNPAGKFNFSTIGQREKEKKPAIDKEPKERTPKENKEAVQPSFLLSLIDISGGDIHYVDQKEGADLQMRQIDLKVEDLDLNQPFSVSLAAAVYDDKQNLKFKGKVGPLRSDSSFDQAPLDGDVDIDPLDITRIKTALPSLKTKLPKDLDLSGVFRVKNLKFKGTFKDLAINGEVEGTNGALRHGKDFQKAEGIPFRLNADARYAGDKITIRSGRMKLYTADLTTAGEIQLGDTTTLNLSINSAPVSLEGWDKIVPAVANYKLAGTMEFQANVRGQVGNGAMPQIQGVLSLQKASAKPPEFPKPIENLDTKISFTGQRANISEMNVTLGRSRIRMTATIEKFSPLMLSYKMSAPEIFPADYRAGLDEGRKEDVIRNLQSEGHLSMIGGNVVYKGKLTSAEGTLYNVAYKSLDAMFSVADKVANIQNLRVNAMSGTVQAEGEYSFKEAVPRFLVASKAQGVDVKELYTALDAKAERDIRGRLNTDMKLAGSGKSWEEIKPTLRGQGEAEVVQGAVLNFNIAESTLGGVTGVPGLTNMINPGLRKKYPETFAAKDTEFKEMKATFEMGDGRINVKNLRMAAAEFTSQGQGWADFNRRVDFRSTIDFSQRLSADIAQSTQEVKYFFNNQGQLELPIILKGRMPNVKPKPDGNYLAQMAQRNFLRKGMGDLKNPYLGDKEAGGENTKKSRRKSTEDMIRKGLEGLFGRESR